MRAANEEKAVRAAEVAKNSHCAVKKVIFLDNIKENTDRFVSEFCENYSKCADVHAIHMQTNASSKDPKSTTAFETLWKLFSQNKPRITAQESGESSVFIDDSQPVSAYI